MSEPKTPVEWWIEINSADDRVATVAAAMTQARRSGWLACREACAVYLKAGYQGEWAEAIRALEPPEEGRP